MKKLFCSLALSFCASAFAGEVPLVVITGAGPFSKPGDLVVLQEAPGAGDCRYIGVLEKGSRPEAHIQGKLSSQYVGEIISWRLPVTTRECGQVVEQVRYLVRLNAPLNLPAGTRVVALPIYGRLQ